ARAFARAAELTPAPAERARRLLEAAIDHVAAGALEQAEADADAALPLEADPLVRTGLQRIRAHVLIRSGRPGEGAEAMAEVAREVADEIPPLGAAMLLEAALGRMLTGPGSSALAHARRAAELGAGVEIIEGVADVIMAHTLLATGDSASAAARLAARVGFLLDADPPPGVTEAIAGGAHTFMWLEDFDRSQKILDRLIEVARNEGALARLCYPLTIRSQLGYRRGHWSAAYADAVEAARASAETGQESNLSYALQMMAEIEAGLGKFADARQHASESLEIARRSETPVFGPYARLALGAVAAGDDDVEGAVAEYERARDEIVAIGMPAPCELFATVELVELHVRGGDAGAAADELARLEALVTPGHPPVHQAQLTRCRGLVLDGTSAIEALRGAVALHDASSTPFERARTELVLGERLRRDRQRTEARAPLRAALETFERLGARAWAERARSELRASGAASGRGEIPVADVLTPHELQVAMIVAKGATNKEAAAALFVSPKTVEHHLGQIYRKLDLRSRTELTALLSASS
ncbi:MAG TPA: LuxR C-terminal-related transcriptional regulator, partial [Solirubrobacteraceae bacterium]|nr:LuxR C-terminal-related transcriptional regulator [Solirubrobacteraceae bacterium]